MKRSLLLLLLLLLRVLLLVPRSPKFFFFFCSRVVFFDHKSLTFASFRSPFLFPARVYISKTFHFTTLHSADTQLAQSSNQIKKK